MFKESVKPIDLRRVSKLCLLIVTVLCSLFSFSSSGTNHESQRRTCVQSEWIVLRRSAEKHTSPYWLPLQVCDVKIQPNAISNSENIYVRFYFQKSICTKLSFLELHASTSPNLLIVFPIRSSSMNSDDDLPAMNRG